MKTNVFESELIRLLEYRSGGCLQAKADWISGTNRARIRVIKLHMEDCCLMPLVYPDDFRVRFEEGESMEELADEILEQVKRTRESNDLPQDFFRRYEDVKDRIFCRLICADRNEDLLQEIPHELQENLAIVYYYEFPDGWMEDATILIRNEHLQLWDRAACEIKNVAWKNTLEHKKVKFCKLSRVLREYGMEETDEMERNPLYLLSSAGGGFGAITAFYPRVLADCAEQLGGDLVLLPSSIHEWLLFPLLQAENTVGAEALRNMVREINRTQLAEKEILSDEIYYYDALLDRVRMI